MLDFLSNMKKQRKKIILLWGFHFHYVWNMWNGREKKRKLLRNKNVGKIEREFYYAWYFMLAFSIVVSLKPNNGRGNIWTFSSSSVSFPVSQMKPVFVLLSSSRTKQSQIYWWYRAGNWWPIGIVANFLSVKWYYSFHKAWSLLICGTGYLLKRVESTSLPILLGYSRIRVYLIIFVKEVSYNIRILWVVNGVCESDISCMALDFK